MTPTAGTFNTTAERMIRIAYESHLLPEVRRWATQAVRGIDDRSNVDLGAALALTNALRASFVGASSPTAEYFLTPLQILKGGDGALAFDPDEATTLLLACLLSLNVQAPLAVLFRAYDEHKTFSHVLGAIFSAGAWRPLDPCYPEDHVAPPHTAEMRVLVERKNEK